VPYAHQMDPMNLDYELHIATIGVKNAARIALEEQKSLKVSYKPHGQGPVTNVDTAVDHYLISHLRQYFPNDKIISEESYNEEDTPIAKGRVWFLDPIDGTRALVTGIDDFVIMVGLSIDGKARLGVIYQPTKDILWQGITNDRHWAQRINDKDILNLKAHTMPPDDQLTIVASISHNSKRQQAMINLLKPKHVLYKGSLGLKAMLVVQGDADLCVAWSKDINLWDTCAPTAIIKAAGAHICNIDNQELDFYGSIKHQKPIIIANKCLSKELYIAIKNLAA
jgi:3'(2'), 5'-bisphosphate nucleotidase